MQSPVDRATDMVAIDSPTAIVEALFNRSTMVKRNLLPSNKLQQGFSR
ncbi:MAG: hypothetical protein QXL28_03775 [Desulfurococcaceae archaeon]